MRRVRLVLEYDGTEFRGFQRQASVPSIQGELERVLSKVCDHPVHGVGAGRTDAGVHALGQVFHFDTTGQIPTERIPQVVNNLLNPAIVIRHAEDTDEQFHARFGAVRRTYEYFVSRRRPDPVLARYTVFDRRLRPDAGARMNAALPAVVGKHDFTAFCSAECQARTKVRTVVEARVDECGEMLRFRIAADGFLQNMVRIISGLLLEIGRGEREPEALGAALEARDRVAAGVTAPPQGLFLMRVDYPDGYPGGAALETAPFWDRR